MTIDYLIGDALETVRGMPADSVDLVASSPPFLALRNYNDLDGQWGSEATPADFLDNLLLLADELGRVLTPAGTLAFELGDTYSGSGGAGGDYTTDGLRDGQATFRANRGAGWPLAKSLTLVPTLFAASLAYGHNLLQPSHNVFEPWRIRNLIVWARNNPLVGALGDKVRPATSYITVATRSPKRWFDLDAVRTPHTTTLRPSRQPGGTNRIPNTGSRNDDGKPFAAPHHPAGAPPLDHWHDEYDGDHTWLINPNGSNLAHYAMWPAKLAERLILSMCPAEVCNDCDQPRRRITSTSYEAHGNAAKQNAESKAGARRRQAHLLEQRAENAQGMTHGRATKHTETVGWSDCGHGNYRPGHVLDPFAGSATTMCVAEVHGRDSTGIDLDPANRELMPRRMAEVKRNLYAVTPELAGQGTLL